jgi:hypothetical protein
MAAALPPAHFSGTPAAHPKTKRHCAPMKLRRAVVRHASNQSSIANRVVRGTIRSRPHQPTVIVQCAGNAMDPRCLNCFFERHRRQDCGDSFREHGFPRARWPNERNVVAAGTGYFQGPFGCLLSMDVAKIDVVLSRPASICPASTFTAANDSGQFTRSTACGSDFNANTLTPSTTAASRAFASGTAIDFNPLSRAASAAESAPRTGRTPPSSDNSPRNMHWSSGFPKNCPMHPASPKAMGKSNPEPSLRTSAGARLMVTPCPLNLTAGAPGAALHLQPRNVY